MIKKFKYVLIFIFIFSCKTGVEKIKVNSLKIDYNILFNGENFFNEGLKVLKNNYNENYWEIIPLIDGLKYSQQSSLLPTKNFQKSEEKAIKAIQKSKKNQTKIQDRAYLLLGKSRFYDQKYISALQAFNQVDQRIQEAILWKTMIYLNLDQSEIAVKKIKEEVQKAELDSLGIDLLKAITQSEISNNNYNEALVGLKKLYKKTNDKDLKSRSSFISAQIYSKLNMIDSAKTFFSKTLKSGISKSSEIYLRSKLRLMYISDSFKLDDYNKLIKSERYPEKQPLILYYMALTGLKNNADQAVFIFNKSLKLNNDDRSLKLRTYRNLLDINYDRGNYFISSRYVDSLLNYEDQSSKDFFDLKNLKKRLAYISELEEKNIQIDSAIILSNLSDKEIQILLKKTNPEPIKVSKEIVKQSKNGIFYYSNQAAINSGAEDFRKKWGKIKLEDNWKMKLTYVTEQKENLNKNKALDNIIQDSNFKLGKIEIDSLKRTYNQNLLLLAVYYNEFFKDLNKSLEKIEKIDYEFLNHQEIPKSKYYKYLAYIEKDKFKSKKIKNDILYNHSNSIYAKRISQKKSTEIRQLNNSIDSLRSLLEENNFTIASKTVDSILRFSTKREDLYKLKMIQSKIIVKREGVDPYISFLINLKLEFPEKKENLQKIINTIKDIKHNKSLDLKNELFVLGFFKNKIYDHSYDGFQKEYYNDEIDLIVKYGFISLEEAKLEAEKLFKRDKRLLNNKYFVLSTSQFINALVFKTLDKNNL